MNRNLFWVGCLPFLAQCTSSVPKNIVAEKIWTGRDSVWVCDISKVRDTVTVPLSRLVEDIRILQLDDNDDNAFVRESETYISDGYIGIRGDSKMPFKLFDRSGKFIGKIGNIGKGPGEYFAIYSAVLDEKNDRIYLQPWMSKQINVYDFKGNNYDPIPLAYELPKGHISVDTENRTVTAGIVPFSGVESVVWKQDFDGNVLQEIDAAPFFVQPDYSHEAFFGGNCGFFDFYFLTFDGRRDSLYHYDDARNRLRPVFTLDFPGEEKTPLHIYYELPGYYLADISLPGQPARTLMVDKRDGSGSWVSFENDFWGGIPSGRAFNFRNGYYMTNVNPVTLHEQLEKALENPDLSDAVKTKIKNLAGTLKEDSNNLVIWGKLKP